MRFSSNCSAFSGGRASNGGGVTTSTYPAMSGNITDLKYVKFYNRFL